jgi:hypothetical protein
MTMQPFDVYQEIISEITDGDVLKTAALLSEYKGLKKMISLKNLELAIYGSISDNNDRKIRKILEELTIEHRKAVYEANKKEEK